MRRPPFDPTAKKRTVSLTLNGDLYAKAKGHGINATQVADAFRDPIIDAIDWTFLGVDRRDR